MCTVWTKQPSKNSHKRKKQMVLSVQEALIPDFVIEDRKLDSGVIEGLLPCLSELDQWLELHFGSLKGRHTSLSLVVMKGSNRLKCKWTWEVRHSGAVDLRSMWGCLGYGSTVMYQPIRPPPSSIPSPSEF